MRKLLLILILAATLSSELPGQTTISGTITSLNGQPISNLVIKPHASGQSDLFDQIGDIRPDAEGNYEIEFTEPGIYSLRITAVHHQSLFLPVTVFDQDRIDMDIRLVPRYPNDGRHFDKESYREWIRAYGNFNGYDFHSGIIFDENVDGSISAMLPADRDTIRYQVRGITGGAAPLPDEQHTHLREDRTFEGVIIPPTGADSAELRYDPASETVYTKDIELISHPSARRPNAQLVFADESDFMWIQPLSLINSTWLSYESNSGYSLTPEEPNRSSSEITLLGSASHIRSARQYRSKIREHLAGLELHPQQRAALYIAYLGLIQQENRRTRFMTDHEGVSDTPSLEFLHRLIEEVHPLHPLWARNPGAATQLLKQSEFDPQIEEYSQQIVREHPDDLVVRNLVLEMIEENARQYNDAREMPEYRWIVERYGESNLARKAIVAYLRATRE